MISQKPNSAIKATKSVTQLSMATLRLQKDLKDFNDSKIIHASLEFPEPSNLQEIIININLQLTKQQLMNTPTPYNNIKIKFQLNFPNSYPIDPPKLKCMNKIFHPNINYNGSVCLPLVREDWSPTVTLEAIIYGLIFILLYPNGQDALEPQIGDLMGKDIKLFQKVVLHTIQGRAFKQKQYDKLVY